MVFFMIPKKSWEIQKLFSSLPSNTAPTLVVFMCHRRRSSPAGPVLAGPLFLAVPAVPVFGRPTGPLEQHSNPTHGLHVLLAGPLFEAVLRHTVFICSIILMP